MASAGFTALPPDMPLFPHAACHTLLPTPPPSRRRRGRPSLPPDERVRRIKACKEAWKLRNYEYYRKQIATIQKRKLMALRAQKEASPE
jgi:hypothetical protein